MADTGIDLADLNLYVEVADVDPEATSSTQAPPPPDSSEYPDGDPRQKGYLCIPQITLTKDGKPFSRDKNGKLQMSIKWHIQDEGLPMPETSKSGLSLKQWTHGVKGLTLSSWPSVRMNLNSTTDIDILVKCYTGQSAVAQGLVQDGQKLGKVYQYIAQGYPVRVMTSWDARVREGDKENQKTFKKKMKNFYNPQTGRFVPITESPDGLEASTEARVIGYNPR